MWKKGQALVPTWTAFVVVRLLENHFKGLIDYGFTADMEEQLDRIARGEVNRTEYLRIFYFGEGAPGLKELVSDNIGLIDAAEINAIVLGLDDNGESVTVRPGKFGPYVKRGEDTASVPDDLPPDELSVAKALELLAAPKGDTAIGEIDGFPLYAKNGRYGPYVQWGDADNLPPGLDKPKMASLFKTMNLERISVSDAQDLLSLPRTLGNDPADGTPILAQNGRFGPYVSKGSDTRNLTTEEQLLTVTLAEALEMLAQPKQFRGRGAPKPPLRDFGPDPVSGKPILAKEGRFGTYVTDGETNASLGRGDRLEEMSAERAHELLAIRREAIIEKGGAPAKRVAKAAKAAKKAAPAKAAAPKKAAAKKAARPAKKAAKKAR